MMCLLRSLAASHRGRPGLVALAAAALLIMGCRAASETASQSDSQEQTVGPRTRQSAAAVDDDAAAWLVQSAPHLGRPSFAGSSACRECHADQHGSWHQSYHRTMTQLATPENVIGDFDAARVTSRAGTFELSRKGDEFWVEMIDPQWRREQLLKHGESYPVDEQPDAPRMKRRVVMTTGYHHYQTYWVRSTDDRRQLNFPFVYLRDDQRWAPREDVFLWPILQPGIRQIWNETCIRCHVTAGQPHYDAEDDAFDSRVAELGISCEACHGPAAEHVAYHRDLRDQPPERDVVQPAKLPQVAGAQVCGQCHSITEENDHDLWLRDGFPYRAGDDLWEHRVLVRHLCKAGQPLSDKTPPTIPRADDEFLDQRFWSDGMVRVSGREYNGLIESACYLNGKMTCLSCHSMHKSDPSDQLARGMDTDHACTQCHQDFDKPSLVEAHTHHHFASDGSRCYNCHMPHTTYGLLKAIRSHEISSPSVQESVEHGRPNACNLCHLDRTLDWTARHLDDWYDIVPPPLARDQQQVSAAASWLLEGDAGQRALVAWHLGWTPAQEASGRDWMPPYLAQLMGYDPYSAVRYIAGTSLSRIPNFDAPDYDFVAPPAQRAQAGKDALSTWRKGLPRSLDRFGPHLLIDKQGNIDGVNWDRLLRNRDDRVISLAE